MISTKGRYALRIMIDLAEHDGEGYVPLKDIAERQHLSKKYLEIIVKDLVNGKLVTGVSGKGGGYRLCKKPEEYSIGELLEHTEGSLSSVWFLSVCETIYTNLPTMSIGEKTKKTCFPIHPMVL